MCFDRIQDGKEPACVQACPTDALVFGQKTTIIQKAIQRKTQINGYLYGDVDNKPLGGTGFIYVADVKLQTLGIPEVSEQTSIDIPVMTNSKLLIIPAIAGSLFYLAAWRKRRMEE
jgi:Fe-S-cluster-containing dehydrogenase component